MDCVQLAYTKFQRWLIFLFGPRIQSKWKRYAKYWNWFLISTAIIAANKLKFSMKNLVVHKM